MNNDDIHLNNIQQQFDFNMQNLNNSLNQNDDNCMDLLDKLTYDDNTSTTTLYTSTNVGMIDNEKFAQEVQSALERNDYDRKLTLSLSQSNNGHKMGKILSDMIHDIEKNKPIDGKLKDKINNAVRSQTTPLRATVAPIRNESIVCSSNSNMSNITGFRSNKPTKTEAPQDDFLSLMSSDCKVQSGTRSLPATPPISQVPNRPSSSHCIPIRSNEQRKRSDCDIDQQLQQQISSCSYGTPQQNNQQASMQFLPINMNQFAQYQQSMMPPNIVIMPLMNTPETTQTAVSQSNQMMGQTNQSNNPISYLVGPHAFFSMPNSGSNQTNSTTTSHDAGSMINATAASNIRSSAIMTTTSHGSNLPKLLPKLPKPQHPIMPRTLQYQPTGQIMHQITTQPIQNNINQIQTFKRPTNRKSSVKSRPNASRSSKSTKKENSNNASCNNINNNKDNVLMAWEMSGQCGGDDDSAASSFVNELTNGIASDAQQYCIIPTGLDNASIDSFCHGINVMSDASIVAANSIPPNQPEFDDILDELVTILDLKYAQLIIEEDLCSDSAVASIEPVTYFNATVIEMINTGYSISASQQAMIPSSNCVVIARQSPLVDSTPSRTISSSIASATASNVEQQRVMQLIYAHLGHHSEILTPLLKCFLPSTEVASAPTQPQQSRTGTGTAPAIQHHSRPLSVCTRLSEQDELTEDDLLADISPIKRDPTQLANLDRFLESCQSISPCSSLMQEYDEEHEEPQFDEVCPPKLMLPFQTNIEDNLTIQDFSSSSNRPDASWLRKSKQRNKWILNSSVIRSTKVLELPTAQVGNFPDKRKEKSLNKKANYKKSGTISVTSESKLCKQIHQNSAGSKRSVKYLEKIRKIKSDNHGNVVEPQMSQDSHCNHSQPLTNDKYSSFASPRLAIKVKISLSHMKIVSTTTKRPLDPPPPPPPLINIPIRTKVTAKQITTKTIKQTRRTKMIKSNPGIISPPPPPPPPPLIQRQAKKYAIESNISSNSTKRIFCTRKEDRRSSAALTNNTSAGNSNSSTSPMKHRKISPCKMKRIKHQQIATPERPPLILKLAATKPQDRSDKNSSIEMSSPEQPMETVGSSPSAQNMSIRPTTGLLKLKLIKKRSSVTEAPTNENQPLSCSCSSSSCCCCCGIIKPNYEFSPNERVNLVPPPSLQHRSRPQLAGLQFSPTQSTSDSDSDVAHNEISSLLQRQEQRDPLSGVGNGAAGSAVGSVMTAGGHADSAAATNHHSFTQLPVPYLVGSDPTVFIDPHEFDLVVVKNSKYKKVSQRQLLTGTMNALGNGANHVVDVVSDSSNINELFVPGCFIEHDKSSSKIIQSSSLVAATATAAVPTSWNHSSPSMPVLAPQEPFCTSTAVSGGSVGIGCADNSAVKSNHISLQPVYDYSSQSQINLSNQQSYSDTSDRLQQSPLCMTTSSNPPQSSQYSVSQNDVMRSDTVKSPTTYQHQSSSYYQPQQSYSSSCYLADNSITAAGNQSKTQIHSSPLATTGSSSHIQDYSAYFQNASQIQSHSSDTASFSSISLTSSAYQPLSDHQTSSKHGSSKRSSNSRSHHQSDQTSTKKRKEQPAQPSLQLPSYSNNADIYNAAVQYSNLDYYSNGFSDIIGGIDRVKLYEQWSRECSNPLNAFCGPNLPWNSAMAEYCKQAASLMPQTGSAASSSGFGIGANSNPLALTSNLNPVGGAMDYSNDISHSVDTFKYLDSYTAYAMSQPYMYSTFGGIPK